MKYPVRIVVALMIMLVISGLAVQAQQRPHDPWVFYSVLEGGPTHAIVVALHNDLWVLYDFSENTLYKAINGGVNISDPTSPDPYYGSTYMERVNAPTWRVFHQGEQVEAQFVYRGHRFEGEYVRLLYGAILAGGVEIGISELLDVRDRPDEDSFGLIRLLETVDVPEGIEIMLTLPQGSGLSGMNSTVPLMQYEGHAVVKLVPNGGTLITTYF